MRLRRALLLFAVVLGLAAIAAAISRPGDEPAEPPSGGSGAATASPGPGPAARERAVLEFEASRDQTRRVAVGRPATVTVRVDEAGQVAIPLLGVVAPAEAVTPARFEVLPTEARRYPITFTPAADDDPRSAGTLVVTPAAE